MEILLGIGIILIILAGIIIRNLLKQTEQLEDLVIETRVQTRIQVMSVLTKMKDLDIRGAFEADDEVGAVFTEMKQIIEELTKELED